MVKTESQSKKWYEILAILKELNYDEAQLLDETDRAYDLWCEKTYVRNGRR